ncbi:MAG: hypothetical protein C4576_19730 [Desulfobacteraceae bacterium]|nr:MAG: hypothetical protein C4576_19730 [Desulfobacteraceae bacterium]
MSAKKAKEQRRLMANRKAIYDHLYFNQGDPVSANLALMVLELERLHETEGVIPCFSNLKETGKRLSEFMKRNEAALTQLFNEHFPDPEAYLFGKFKMELRHKGDC